MQRIYLIISLMVVLFGCGLVLDTYRATRTVQAQTNPNAPTAPNAIYLPLIAGGASPIKGKSGIHMGNRGNGTDWDDKFFQRLHGTAAGKWPAATVVLSNQLYHIERSTLSPCLVSKVTVRATHLYTYLTQAIQNKTKVVIRLYPSPGNFKDYNSPGQNHVLRADQTPAGGDYCGSDQSQKSDKYRDILDLVSEMNAIWQLNRANGWPPEQFFFEPANEPNNEWYTQVRDKLRDANPNAELVPYVDNKTAWLDLDNYFANLYDLAHQVNTELQVLTPPIGQENWAEHYKLHSCDVNTVLDAGSPVAYRSGYDFMERTYGQGRFAGFSWHNYWLAGEEHEKWGADVVTTCRDNVKATPTTDHIYQYFPAWMQLSISPVNGRPTFITEADLDSICNKPNQPITNKILYPTSTALSLRRFFAEEQGALYVVGWLLVQADDGTNNCYNNRKDGNYEIAWHEAFQDDLDEYYEWFRFWWVNEDE